MPPSLGRLVGHARHRKMEKALIGDAVLPPAPDTFDPALQYRISVVSPVPVVPGDTSHMIRPNQLVIVSGAFAQSIRQFIAGAQAL